MYLFIMAILAPCWHPSVKVWLGGKLGEKKSSFMQALHQKCKTRRKDFCWQQKSTRLLKRTKHLQYATIHISGILFLLCSSSWTQDHPVKLWDRRCRADKRKVTDSITDSERHCRESSWPIPLFYACLRRSRLPWGQWNLIAGECE